jgi:hypothetical protein
VRLRRRQGPLPALRGSRLDPLPRLPRQEQRGLQLLPWPWVAAMPEEGLHRRTHPLPDMRRPPALHPVHDRDDPAGPPPRRSLARSTPRSPPRTRAPLRLEVDAVARPGTLLPSSTNGSDPSPVSAANGAELPSVLNPRSCPLTRVEPSEATSRSRMPCTVASSTDRPPPADGCCPGRIQGPPVR